MIDERNAQMVPSIPVFYQRGLKRKAEFISFGIEEEGLPFLLQESESAVKLATQCIAEAGLGVAITVQEERVCIFCRLLKESRPFLVYQSEDMELLKACGKNAARIIKHKPLIIFEEKFYHENPGQ